MRWLPAILGLCAGVAVAQGCTELITPSYQASASILVTAGAAPGRVAQADRVTRRSGSARSDDGPPPAGAKPPGSAAPSTGSTPIGGYRADLVRARAAAPTVARLIGSREVAVDTAGVLGVPANRVDGHLTGTFEAGTEVILVRATGSSSTGAAALANAGTEALRRQLGRLHGTGEPGLDIRILDRATPPVRPTEPAPVRNGTIGGLAGLLAGIGLSRLRDRVDDRIRVPAQVETRLRLPVLGVLPVGGRLAGQPARALLRRREVSEAVNAAVAAVAVAVAPLPRRRILVTSTQEQDAKGLVAALLALGFVSRDRRVTLVEAQRREPALTEHFPESTRGCTVGQAIDGAHPGPLAGHPDLTVLPELVVFPDCRLDTGPATSDGPFGRLVDDLAAGGDLVLIHAPPVLRGTELAALARHADGAVLVVAAAHTRAPQAHRAAQLIEQLDVPLVGVVVTAAAVGAAGKTARLERDLPVDSTWLAGPFGTPRRASAGPEGVSAACPGGRLV